MRWIDQYVNYLHMHIKNVRLVQVTCLHKIESRNYLQRNTKPCQHHLTKHMTESEAQVRLNLQSKQQQQNTF